MNNRVNVWIRCWSGTFCLKGNSSDFSPNCAGVLKNQWSPLRWTLVHYINTSAGSELLPQARYILLSLYNNVVHWSYLVREKEQTFLFGRELLGVCITQKSCPNTLEHFTLNMDKKHTSFLASVDRPESHIIKVSVRWSSTREREREGQRQIEREGGGG